MMDFYNIFGTISLLTFLFYFMYKIKERIKILN